VKAAVDPASCTGHGRCYAVAPTVFVDDAEGYGQVIGDGVYADSLADDARRGAGACPERAITVEGTGPGR
jgi:ferredoxin